jgi:hypothetical protein
MQEGTQSFQDGTSSLLNLRNLEDTFKNPDVHATDAQNIENYDVNLKEAKFTLLGKTPQQLIDSTGNPLTSVLQITPRS